MNPADIANKQFTTVRLREGYDQGEVDDFLDEVEGAYTAVLRRAEAAEQRLAVAQHQASTAQTTVLPPAAELLASPVAEMHVPSLSSISLLLKNAEKTAEDLLTKAKGDAEAEASRLRVEAAGALQAARDEAAKLVAQAQQDAAVVVADAQGKSNELAGKLAQLQVTYNDVVNKLRAALTAFGEAA
jgi:DivIVA domain-containing protein